VELDNLYPASNIITTIKSRRMIRAGQLALMGKRGMHIVFVGKQEGKGPPGRSRHRWEDNVQVDLKRYRIGWYGLD
jgi:hypothetical protein